MECNRNGCNYILCRRYSDKYGYICEECFDELERYVEFCEGCSIYELIDTFMSTKRSQRFYDAIEPGTLGKIFKKQSDRI